LKENKESDIDIDIETLRRENERLKQEKIIIQKNVLKVEKIKEVLPPNYETDMRRLKYLETQCRKLQKMIDYGNISSLQTLIEQFTAYSRVQLKKISVEMQLTEYGESESQSIQEFITYLGFVKEELHNLIFLQSKNFFKSPLHNQCEDEMAKILFYFQQTEKLIELPDEKLKELFFTLQSFNEILEQYFREGQADE